MVWGSLGGKGLPDLHTKFMMSGQGGHTTLKMQIIFTRKEWKQYLSCPAVSHICSFTFFPPEHAKSCFSIESKPQIDDLHDKNWVPFKPLWHYIDVPK